MIEPTRSTKLTSYNWHIIRLMNTCIQNENGQPNDKRKRLIEKAMKNFKLAAVMKLWINNLNAAVLNNEISREKIKEFWEKDAAGFCNNSEACI